MLVRPSRAAVEAIVRMALLEDAPWGDLTSQTLLPDSATVSAHLVAREGGVLCGEDLIEAAFTLTDPAVSVRFERHDGDTFPSGARLATIQGPARAILQAERIALNFAQRLCGIATLTAAYVGQTKGTRARITDTRKTTPGLRLFERYAVRCGGGQNHRFSLSDAVMAKDNHLALLSAKLPEALRSARAALPHTVCIEVEIDRLEQLSELEPLLGAAVHTVLLDNFSLEDLRIAVERIAHRALTEASGGITLESVAAIAATGVDILSVGALTHSPRALDLGLDIEAAASSTEER
ncbi:MAG: carboxylating nicotinate-nucleotide diphosphorylase [Acidobacteriaceae bacterium]